MHVIDHFRAVGRRPTSLSARLESSDGRALAVELVNLGLGGACVVVRTELDAASVARLRIEAPQLWEPLILPASVAWTRREGESGTRLGIRFETDSAATLTILTELVGYNGYL